MEPNDHQVILIHGFGRGTGSMSILMRRLRSAGFSCSSVGYRWWRSSLEWAASTVADKIRQYDVNRIDLVGHSFGGLVALHLKQEYSDLPIRRVVQMGSPNLGSDLAGRAHRVRAVREIAGPTLDEVLPRSTGDATSADVLAIAGTGFPDALGRLYGVRGPSDALIEEASAYGAALNRSRVNAVHGWLPLSKRVADITAHFLKTGEVLR